MKTRMRIVVALCAAVAFQTVVLGAEYFANKEGADANDGASRETAFLTIGKGVVRLLPHSLTILRILPVLDARQRHARS